ncbi:MAG TPA: glycosyltransferase, partial [Solirubrobacterales bacterium]
MSENGTPLISVVIPAFNGEATLANTLESLLAQTFEDWEGVVVDDGSTDDTAGVAARLVGSDSRFRVHTQPNGGVSRARNAGIALAKAPWLFFLDADDWIAPDAFESLLRAPLEQTDVVHGGFVRIDAEGREEREEAVAAGTDLFPILVRTCAFSIHCCLSRTEQVRAVGGFDESLATCEDWDLWQRLARSGAHFARIPEYIAY